MKKLIALFAATILILSLTGCNFNSTFTDSVGTKEMAAKEQVAQMMEALTYKDMDAALALMHPDVLADAKNKEIVTDRLQQMMDYVDSRKVLSLTQQSLNVKSSSGTAGNVKQEQAAFQVMFAEETVYISVVYLTQNGSSGFTSYQLVLGVV